MARRRPDSLTLDLFGFDPVGAGYSVTPAESRGLLGLGVLPLAVWHVLKRFVRGDGKVYAASYYRLAFVLSEHATGPGRRAVEPSRRQLRTALDRLQAAGLVIRPSVENERRGVLEIWLVGGVGGTVTRPIRAGYRAGSESPETRMNA